MRASTLAKRGFTLVEVVVAIFVVGSIIVATGTLLKGVQVGTLVREQDLALKIASNKIETLRAGGYAALPADGPFSDASLALFASSTATVTTTAYNAKTKQVDVAVVWVGHNQSPQTILLTTLLTETGGL